MKAIPLVPLGSLIMTGSDFTPVLQPESDGERRTILLLCKCPTGGCLCSSGFPLILKGGGSYNPNNQADIANLSSSLSSRGGMGGVGVL